MCHSKKSATEFGIGSQTFAVQFLSQTTHVELIEATVAGEQETFMFSGANNA